LNVRLELTDLLVHSMANSRLYVHKSVASTFIDKFRKLASNRNLGDPTDSEVNHGPQADKVQYDTVHKYIGLASNGAVQNGNSEDEPLIVHPVVLTDQPEDSQVVKEEIFGPVVVINTFETEEEAIQKANDTEYGLYAA
jgi:aldehyde dehydrogenase (NAD+)